jgi:hypothetical protein
MVNRQAVIFKNSTAGSKGTGCYICGESGHAAKVCPTLKGGRPHDPPQKYKESGVFQPLPPKGGEIVGTKKRAPKSPAAATRPESAGNNDEDRQGAGRAAAERAGSFKKKGLKTRDEKVPSTKPVAKPKGATSSLPFRPVGSAPQLEEARAVRVDKSRGVVAWLRGCVFLSRGSAPVALLCVWFHA